VRTTLKLDDDALALAQAYAKVHCWPLGKAVSELIRHASAPPVGLKKKGDLWVLAASPAAPKVGTARVRDGLRPLEWCNS
jgi:hypothetical protein